MNNHAVCNSIIYCAERDTLCAGIDYTGSGTCRYKECILEEPGYQKRQEAIRIRREELREKHKRDREEERTAAAKIRTQTKTREELLQKEMERRKQRMNRYYTKGWTRLADKESRELASLERELRRTSPK